MFHCAVFRASTLTAFWQPVRVPPWGADVICGWSLIYFPRWDKISRECRPRAWAHTDISLLPKDPWCSQKLMIFSCIFSQFLDRQDSTLISYHEKTAIIPFPRTLPTDKACDWFLSLPIYRVTIQVVSNLPLTLKQRLRFSTRASYWNGTFVMMSMGGLGTTWCVTL